MYVPDDYRLLPLCPFFSLRRHGVLDVAVCFAVVDRLIELATHGGKESRVIMIHDPRNSD